VLESRILALGLFRVIITTPTPGYFFVRLQERDSYVHRSLSSRFYFKHDDHPVKIIAMIASPLT